MSLVQLPPLVSILISGNATCWGLIKRKTGTVCHSTFTQDGNLKTQAVQIKATWIVMGYLYTPYSLVNSIMVLRFSGLT
jgi:hypothetical protein